jgi:type I restriction enzyme, S subunit
VSGLPQGWAEVRVGDVAASLVDGPFGSNLKTEHYTQEGARVIRLQNIGDGRFDDTDKAFISDDRYQLLRRHVAEPGDVLIAALGDVLPRVCLVPPELGPAIVKADCFSP